MDEFNCIQYIKSLSEFFACFEDKSDPFFYQKKEKNEENEKREINNQPILYKRKTRQVFWFRGHEDYSYHLWPNLYRKIYDLNNSFQNLWDTLALYEKAMVDEYKVRNYHFLDGKIPENLFMWLSLMQHQEVATRLLDWTEDAIAGLFFSLENYYKREKKVGSNVLPCIWVLKPRLLNEYIRKSIHHINKNQQNKSQNITSLFSLLEMDSTKYPIEKIIKTDKKEGTFQQWIDNGYGHYFYPKAVAAPYNNERIKVQRGAFIVFPLFNLLEIFKGEPYLENLEYSNEFLRKYVLMQPRKISEELKMIGIKRSMFYPEMPNVSVEVEDEFFRDP